MTSTASSSARRADVDWLRVLAVLLLVPFHTARIFNVGEAFYAKNAELSQPLSTFVTIVDPWHMPLLFVLAGAATFFALGRRTPGAYLRERRQRLLVPFLFGLAVVVPPQSVIALLTHGTDPGSPLGAYAHFFLTWGDLSGYDGGFTPAHLWFILFLVGFSVLALPLFVRWRTAAHGGFPAWLGRQCERPGVLFLLGVPLAIAGALPDVGGKNPFFYFTLFVYGYLLFSDERLQRAIDRHWPWALGLGMLTMAVYLVAVALHLHPPKYSLGDVALHFTRTFNTWFWVLGWLGLGRRLLNRPGRVLGYLSEASYPFYILHQTVIVIVGYLVVQTDLPLGLKFASIALLATLMTFGLYEGLIRRWNPVRALFGMAPRRDQMWTRSMGSAARPARSSAQARSGTSSQFLINQ